MAILDCISDGRLDLKSLKFGDFIIEGMFDNSTSISPFPHFLYLFSPIDKTQTKTTCKQDDMCWHISESKDKE